MKKAAKYLTVRSAVHADHREAGFGSVLEQTD
jgi:hypothetical protein